MLCGCAFKHFKDLKIHRNQENCGDFMQDEAEVLAKEAAAASAVAAAWREVDSPTPQAPRALLP